MSIGLVSGTKTVVAILPGSGHLVWECSGCKTRGTIPSRKELARRCMTCAFVSRTEKVCTTPTKTCSFCGKTMRRSDLPSHMQTDGVWASRRYCSNTCTTNARHVARGAILVKHKLDVFGVSMTVEAVAAMCGVTVQAVKRRLHNGWSPLSFAPRRKRIRRAS
jgi:hypothetical protein